MKFLALLRRTVGGMVAVLTVGVAHAQTDMTKAPASKEARPSPPATATGRIGGADVTVNYSSPAVKGRTIWGGLEPYGKVWRAGANEATTVEFSKDVKVEGKVLPAGKYGFFLIPTEKQWTAIFNKVPDQWGAFKYDEQQDALRVPVKPRNVDMTERLVYEVKPTGLVMRWDKVEIPVSIK